MSVAVASKDILSMQFLMQWIGFELAFKVFVFGEGRIIGLLSNQFLKAQCQYSIYVKIFS